ncbi:MAG: hypothetical protein IPK85_20235 [Gemmatimonadetes bacterium]|nr:hypothetical protein [Gemmatimonadota bacterium]
MPPRQAQSLAKALNLPAFAFQHLSRTPTHTWPEVPLQWKEARWPVMLFSHGFGVGYESQNTLQMEELASHGYVVVSIDHPYEAGVVVFPNGAVIRMAPAPFNDPANAQKLLPTSPPSTVDRTPRPSIALPARCAPSCRWIARWTGG